MEQSFKLTSKTKIRSLTGLLHSLVIFVAAEAFFFYLFEKDAFVPICLFTCLFFLVYVLPVLLLYRNYLRYAKNMDVIIGENRLIVNGKTYTSNNILSIEIFTTMQRVKKQAGPYTLSHNEYFYYILINLENGEELILNSLLGLELDEAIKKCFREVEIKQTVSLFFGLMIPQRNKNRMS